MKRFLIMFAVLFVVSVVSAGLAFNLQASDPFDGCGGVHTQARRAHKTAGDSLLPADCLVPACQTLNTHASYHTCTTFPVPPYPLVCADYSGTILIDTIGVTAACPAAISALTWQ